jgi:hypothetical protein
MSRMGDLLNKAADYLDEEQCSPFCDAFLTANHVTFDECMTMANLMAAGARLLGWALNNPKDASAVIEGAAMGAKHKAFMDAMDRLGKAPS